MIIMIFIFLLKETIFCYRENCIAGKKVLNFPKFNNSEFFLDYHKYEFIFFKLLKIIALIFHFTFSYILVAKYMRKIKYFLLKFIHA